MGVMLAWYERKVESVERDLDDILRAFPLVAAADGEVEMLVSTINGLARAARRHSKSRLPDTRARYSSALPS